jgi:ribosomal protein S18 acetylase RimI-like enzyme
MTASPGAPEPGPQDRTASGWERRCYASFVRFIEAIPAGSGEGGLIELDGVVASISPQSPDRSLVNSVAYEDPAALAAAAEELESRYAEAGVRAWTVWVPEADASTPELLAGRGHRLDARPRSMKLDLSAVSERLDEDLDFTRSADWRVVCAINDASYESIPQGSFEAGFGSKPDPAFRAYCARHEGWDACVLSTIDHDGDCGVYTVATLPEARRNRLAGRLMHRALLDARERGCRTSTLQSSPGGVSVYARLGYEDLGALELWEHRVSAD